MAHRAVGMDNAYDFSDPTAAIVGCILKPVAALRAARPTAPASPYISARSANHSFTSRTSSRSRVSSWWVVTARVPGVHEVVSAQLSYVLIDRDHPKGKLNGATLGRRRSTAAAAGGAAAAHYLRMVPDEVGVEPVADLLEGGAVDERYRPELLADGVDTGAPTLHAPAEPSQPARRARGLPGARARAAP